MLLGNIILIISGILLPITISYIDKTVSDNKSRYRLFLDINCNYIIMYCGLGILIGMFAVLQFLVELDGLRSYNTLVYVNSVVLINMIGSIIGVCLIGYIINLYINLFTFIKESITKQLEILNGSFLMKIRTDDDINIWLPYMMDIHNDMKNIIVSSYKTLNVGLVLSTIDSYTDIIVGITNGITKKNKSFDSLRWSHCILRALYEITDVESNNEFSHFSSRFPTYIKNIIPTKDPLVIEAYLTVYYSKKCLKDDLIGKFDNNGIMYNTNDIINCMVGNGVLNSYQQNDKTKNIVLFELLKHITYLKDDLSIDELNELKQRYTKLISHIMHFSNSYDEMFHKNPLNKFILCFIIGEDPLPITNKQLIMDIRTVYNRVNTISIEPEKLKSLTDYIEKYINPITKV